MPFNKHPQPSAGTDTAMEQLTPTPVGADYGF
jgi:hypothetical protein